MRHEGGCQADNFRYRSETLEKPGLETKLSGASNGWPKPHTCGNYTCQDSSLLRHTDDDTVHTCADAF
jgi:hypothetical protein